MAKETADRLIFIGVDGGGTKTACLVADGTGRILGAGLGGPINLNFVSEETARASMGQAVGSAWRAAGPPPQPPAVAGVSGPIALALSAEIITQETGAASVIGVGEGEAAWKAVSPWLTHDCGVAVDAGTGSLAFGFNREGERAGAGGAGTLLGDEGSGYWIGLEAMRAALRAEDGRGPPTRLKEALCTALSLRHIRELIHLIYQIGMKRHEVAALAPVVAHVAREGDATAARILAEAGRELALDAEAVVRRLKMEDEAFAVVPFGSVFAAGPLLVDPFREAVQQVAPGAQIVEAHYAPVVGSLMAAMEAGGIELKGAFLQHFSEELARHPLALGPKLRSSSQGD